MKTRFFSVNTKSEGSLSRLQHAVNDFLYDLDSEVEIKDIKFTETLNGWSVMIIMEDI
jgi:hypothetical protein